MVDAATDLQMRNDSSHGVLLSARFVPGGSGTPGSVVVDAWSTKEFEVSVATGGRYAPTPRVTVPSTDPACVAVAGADGFTVDLVRTVTRRRRPDAGAQRHRDHDLPARAGRGLPAGAVGPFRPALRARA